MQLYYLIIIESILQDIELNDIDKEVTFKSNVTTVLMTKYEPFQTIDLEKKIQFLVDFIKNKIYEKFLKYNIDLLNKYKKSGNLLIKKCFRKGLKIMTIIYESCLDFPKNKDLIEDNIYYIDYSHINKQLKDKEDIKQIVRNYSYKPLYRGLINYVLSDNKIVDDLYNDCFNTLIKLLAFKESILDGLINDEKNKNLFYDLIIKSLTTNPTVIKYLTDTLKKSISISSSNNNKFINFICDIIKLIFD